MAAITHSAETRLAVYGTLGPGRSNNHQLAGLKGRWLKGAVRGRLMELGWGAEQGFPGIVLDDQGPPVAMDVFESADLPDHWARLDAFEGKDYQRIAVPVELDDGSVVEAGIYVIAGRGDDAA